MDYSNYSNLDAIVWLTYAIPSYSLYIIELLLINCKCLGNSKFRGSFYKIYSVNIVLQVMCNLGYFINFRGGTAPMFMSLYTPGYSFWSVFVAFVSYYGMFYILIGSLLMTFNRFTIFLLKARYEDFWHRYLWVFIIVSLILPCFLLWHIFITKMSVIFEEGRGFTINHTAKLSYWSSSRSGFVLFFATAPLSLILNIYMCKQLMAQRLRKKGAAMAKKSDVQLFFVTIITFLIHCGNSGIQFLFLIPHIESFALYMLKVQCYTTDAATLLPAWTMIMMNRKLRRGVMNLLFGVCTKRYMNNRGESRVAISRIVNPVNHDSHDSQRIRPTVSAF